MSEAQGKILVVQGGPSSEAAVSRTSGAAVTRALREAGYEVVVAELDRALPAEILAHAPAVVFPVTHGAVGEDGSLQGLLEVLAVPYVGAGVRASANAMDKGTARKLFAAAGLPCAPGVELVAGQAFSAAALLATLGDRVVVKAAESGSALGIERLEGTAAPALEAAIARAFSLGPSVVVERFVAGAEVTCGVLDLHGRGPVPLPVTLVETPADAFYSYEARYQVGRSVHRCPAPFAEAVLARVAEVAVRAHEVLACRDLSRVDFLVGSPDDPGSVTLLEVNTLPGFTGTSLFPEAAAVAGRPFPVLCRDLVESARSRGVAPRQAVRPMP